VRAVVGLSNELGMATTAQDVETEAQLALVAAAGCTQVQGYLFSPAVSASAVPELLGRMQTCPPSDAFLAVSNRDAVADTRASVQRDAA